MSAVRQDSCVQITDEALTDARRVRDLLTGAMATRTLDVMRPSVGEAKAIADTLVDKLERFFAIFERARNAASRVEAAKPIGGVR